MAFFEFVQQELPALLERWRERRSEMAADPRADPGDSEGSG
ncbi:hypothetical protein NKH77_11905 [Streptomyces sp. M19]